MAMYSEDYLIVVLGNLDNNSQQFYYIPDRGKQVKSFKTSYYGCKHNNIK